jgi:hypothetical protein
MPIELRNQSDHDFIDISMEISRTYTWPDSSKVSIDQPQWLAVSSSGHRVLDAFGECHYIPNGWIHLVWTVYPPEPHFVK